jgi:hypothetical protein
MKIDFIGSAPYHFVILNESGDFVSVRRITKKVQKSRRIEVQKCGGTKAQKFTSLFVPNRNILSRSTFIYEELMELIYLWTKVSGSAGMQKEG